ncbi:DUF1934 domain-containing protein [Proteinivorax hydrogeniformans]|uniref:DUF1934 domain-containing protein n=1 Tax=Proteinivorax hydrogeniformans TaxID=1826727 RepID=A0AAU8HXI5_9FIRM
MNLTISSSQKNDGESSNIQVDAKGKLYNKNGTDYIVYDEPEGTGLEGTITTVKVKDNQVTLIRSGQTGMKQVFLSGKQTQSLYKTPYGSFPMEVQSEKVEIQRSTDGIKIRLKYNLNVAGQSVGQQTLSLNALKL